MPVHDLSSLPWQLASTPRLSWDAALDDPNRLRDWLPARVPGSIQRDLMAAGRLPDLYQALDLDAVLKGVDAQDWWYRAELPAIPPGQRAWLRFEGIDYQAAVTLDGVELGRGAGMFARRQWEITPWLAGGPAGLAVRVWGGGSLPRWPASRRLRLQRRLFDRLQNGIPAFSDRLLTLKAPLHFGWDFAPRLLAAGIWDQVSLHTARGAAIIDVWARAEWGPERGLVIRLEVDSERARRAQVGASLIPANFSGDGEENREWEVEIGSGLQVLHLRWPEARLQPWATHDRGFPHLYRLLLWLHDADGLLDEAETRVGARTVGWEGTGVVLNGERLFLRGANWIPLDLLRGDEAEDERYRALLSAAVTAGVNALRVWGGGGRERQRFYDLCDELGLLVWQEMPIACVFFDHLPHDAAFLALAQNETAGIIRKLRGHPSVYVWGGGNEWGPGRHRRLASALAEVAHLHDPGRRWLPASPGPGDSHNWQVWHGKAPPTAYASDPAPLLSEFGLAAPPSVETLARMLPPDQLWPPGPAWQARKAEVGKLWHYAAGARGATHLQSASHLHPFVSASQQAQADGLQTGIEVYRLREGAAGCFIWQWNEPWPAICWSLIPYWGPPKPAYAQVARSYAPLAPLARLLPDRIELWLVNDRLESPGVCRLVVRLETAGAGEVLWEGEVAPPANRRARAAVIARPAVRAQEDARLHLHLTGPSLDAGNSYDLTRAWPSPSGWPPLGWLRSRVKAWLLR
ncbi:MAG: hypothetical protein KIS63_19470 [Caldilineales bacterium]|nr:hypothetical protein [Caldilineales bacterium]